MSSRPSASGSHCRSVATSAPIPSAGESRPRTARVPRVEAWAEATGGDSPTRYGQTSLDEGFAEALAFHRVDPEALERAAPRSYAWLEATDLGALAAEGRAAVARAVAGTAE
jgi:hypothetical protein